MSFQDPLDQAIATLPVLTPPPALSASVLDAVALEAAAARLPLHAPPPALCAAVLDTVALDAAAASLPVHDAPEAVQQAVLSTVASPVPARAPSFEPANAPWRWVGLVAVAALALVVVTPRLLAPGPGDLSQMTARGSDELRAEVDLAMAVQRGDGTLERFDRGAVYEAGDTLLFRYATNADTQVALLRVDGRGAALLHQADVPAGQGDLVMTGGLPLGYELEQGEESGVFALVSIDELDATLLAELRGGVPDVVCEQIRARGGWCSAERVEVSP